MGPISETGACTKVHAAASGSLGLLGGQFHCADAGEAYDVRIRGDRLALPDMSLRGGRFGGLLNRRSGAAKSCL